MGNCNSFKPIEPILILVGMNQGLLRAFVVFVMVYVALYILSFLGSSAGLLKWLPGNGFLDFSAFDISRLDYSLWLLPIVGFWLIYMGFPWLRQEFGFGELFEYAFPLLLIVLSYFAFSTAIFYYYQNQAFFASRDFRYEVPEGKPFDGHFYVLDGEGRKVTILQLNYWNYFVNSTFLYFVLAALGGWGARMLIESLDERRPKKGKE